MSDTNPFNQSPVYEEDQVLTFYDLAGIRNGYVHQFNNTSIFNIFRRYHLLRAIMTIDILLNYLMKGKKAKNEK